MSIFIIGWLDNIVQVGFSCYIYVFFVWIIIVECRKIQDVNCWVFKFGD